jgi:hypothetical protein
MIWKYEQNMRQKMRTIEKKKDIGKKRVKQRDNG